MHILPGQGGQAQVNDVRSFLEAKSLLITSLDLDVYAELAIPR